MQDRVLFGLTVLLGIGLAVNALVHWIVVCRRLYRAGARFPTGLLPWRLSTEMTQYKDLCRARGDSLSHYYIILLGLWFSFALGVVLGFVWLTRFQRPPM